MHAHGEECYDTSVDRTGPAAVVSRLPAAGSAVPGSVRGRASTGEG